MRPAEEMVHIHEDAQEPLWAELSEAHQIIDRQHDDLSEAKSDYNQLVTSHNPHIPLLMHL